MLSEAGPARSLELATLADTIGKGMSLAAGVLFLTRVVGLSAAQVGLTLTLSAAVALAGGVLVGERADRLGPRRVYLTAILVQAGALVGLACSRSLPAAMATSMLAATAGQGAGSSHGALVAGLIAPARRTEMLARLRAVTNVGMTLGGLGSGIAAALDTTASYTAVVLVDAASFLVVVAIVLRGVPRVAALERIAGAARWVALADRRYLAVVAVDAVVCCQYSVLTVGVPLWVATSTAAPRAAIAPLIVVNTIGIVALQVAASRRVDGPRRAALSVRRAGLAFVVAWTLLGVAGGTGPLVAVGVLVVAIAVHTAGELWHAAGSFELSFALARPGAQGQYQGVFGLGQGASRVITPVVVAAICASGSAAGWTAFGLVVALAASAAPRIVSRASGVPKLSGWESPASSTAPGPTMP